MFFLPDPIVDPRVAGDFCCDTGRTDDLEDAVCFGTDVYLFDIGEKVLQVLLVLLWRAKGVDVDFGDSRRRVSRRESRGD